MNWIKKHFNWILILFFILIILIGAWIIFLKVNVQSGVLTQIRIFIQYVAVILGSVGVIIALMNYKRKSGHDVLSHLNIVYRKYPEGKIPFVENIWLMNNKDKAEVILAIYVVHNGKKLYLKDMNHSPHILGAYSAVKFNIASSMKPELFIYQWGKDDYSNPESKFTDNNIFDTPAVIDNISCILQHAKGVYIRTFLKDVYAPFRYEETPSNSEDDIHFINLE